MYILDTKRVLKLIIVYSVTSLFIGVLGFVYEQFSHGVYSLHMIYMFIYPLFLGTFPYIILGLNKKVRRPDSNVRFFQHAGVMTLTIGSFLKGILEIYGTSSKYVVYYSFVGTTMVFISCLLYILVGLNENRNLSDSNMPR